jgi:acetamidase/formamidase
MAQARNGGTTWKNDTARSRLSMKRIGKRPAEKMTQQNDCVFGPNVKPIATVSPGEVVEIETYDCFAGTVRPERDLKAFLESGEELFENPVTGPIYVEGAEPGDTLVAEIQSIELGERGATTTVPGFGILEGWFTPIPPISKFSQIKDGMVAYPVSKDKSVKFPVRAMIGTIGVAPATETITTVTPSRHGGNLDTRYVTVGNRIHLPVNVRGALFAVGDAHAAQGAGEVCGTSVEVAAVVRVKLELVKGKRIDWPRIESPEEMMTVCSARPLEDAARLAVRELMKWLLVDYGLLEYDAYMLLSVAGDVEIMQMVDPMYTVVAKIKKSVLSQLK